jgi:hypothetical protein
MNHFLLKIAETSNSGDIGNRLGSQNLFSLNPLCPLKIFFRQMHMCTVQSRG